MTESIISKYIRINYYYFLLIMLALSACHFSNTTFNRKQDIADGKKLVATFYDLVKAQNNTALNQMAADTLNKLIGVGGISKIANMVHNEGGNFKNYKVTDAASRRIEGKSSQVQYKFKLKVTYDKGTLEEDLGFIQLGKAPAKIFAYHAYPNRLHK